MITPDERIQEYERKIKRLNSSAAKHLDNYSFDKAISAIAEAKAFHEAIGTIYVLKGEGWIKSDDV